jgi:hypothetical protein
MYPVVAKREKEKCFIINPLESNGYFFLPPRLILFIGFESYELFTMVYAGFDSYISQNFSLSLHLWTERGIVRNIVLMWFICGSGASLTKQCIKIIFSERSVLCFMNLRKKQRLLSSLELNYFFVTKLGGLMFIPYALSDY